LIKEKARQDDEEEDAFLETESKESEREGERARAGEKRH